MSIVECKDCKYMVSTSAEVCPKCGAKYPASYIPSKIIFHRKSTFWGIAVGTTVTVNGKKVGKLHNNEEVSLELSFGDYEIYGKTNDAFGKISLSVLPARIYNIEIENAGLAIHFNVLVAET